MTEATPLASEQITQEDRITAAIGKADAAFGYSFNLTRLVDGEETHTLSMPGFDPVEFSDRDEGYALIAERRNKARAEAVLAALSASPAPSGQGVSGERRCAASADHADIMETIANAADDWQRNGYTSALAEVRDMANVGRALMEALPEGYSYMNCPSEIVADLQNERDEALAAPAPSCAPGEVERLRKALRPFAFEGVTIPRRLDRDAFWFTDAVTRKSFTVGEVLDARAALSPQGLDAKEGVTLYREVDALGGTGFPDEGESWSRGYSEALSDVLAVLTKRGFTEAADATPSQRLDAATVERCVLDMDFANTPPIDWSGHDWSRLAAALATEPHQHGGKGA